MSELDITQTADELVIRGRRTEVVVGAVLVCLLVPFSLAIAYQDIVGTSEQPAIWNRTGDRVALSVFILLELLAFGVAPILLCLMSLRKRRRPWVFNRRSGQLTWFDQRWPLAELTAVEVDVRRGKGFFRGSISERRT